MANRRKVGIQRSIDGRAKNIESIRTIEENKSTTLRTSPVMINSPFTKSKPAANNAMGKITFTPKISIKNITAAAKSIAPSIFTKTIIINVIWGFY